MRNGGRAKIALLAAVWIILRRRKMSIVSDAAKAHIEKLLNEAYPEPKHGFGSVWQAEYKFDEKRKWRFDYAVPAIKCAIELDGATFKPGTGHTSGVGLRAWREKNNAAMSLGWRVWHYAPEEVIKAGRKTLPDEPILTTLPWLEKQPAKQTVLARDVVLASICATPKLTSPVNPAAPSNPTTIFFTGAVRTTGDSELGE